LNVLAFIGHGVVNEKNEALFLVNSKNDQGNIEIKAINVDQLAKDFAEIKNTMTIIFFVACRDRSSEQFEE
jgi:two-component SAPR family response regulator